MIQIVLSSLASFGRQLVSWVLQCTFPALTRLLLLLLGMFVLGGCTCSPDVPPIPPRTLIACRTHTPRRPAPGTNHPAIQTVPAGTLPGTFSVTSSGEATYVMPLVTVPGRAGVEPQLSLT